MTWNIDLIGEAADIGTLGEFAPFCDCAIADGVDGRPCLGGARFERLSTPEEVRTEAGRTLLLLNGLAQLRYGNHRPVQLGSAVSRLHPDGRRDVAVAIVGVEARARVSLGAVVTRANGEIETVSTDRTAERVKRITADPKLIEITEALAGEFSWQKLRVAFEKATALVGKGDNSLVKERYATQGELDRFKANVQDPRLSGLNAVHGVPKTPSPRGAPMSEKDGLAFVARIFNDYLDRG